MTPRNLGLFVAVLALAADQVCKNLLLYSFGFATMPPYAGVTVLPFFDLVMVWNRGVSYGMFQASGTAGTVILVVFSLAAVIGLGWALWRTRTPILALGLGLIIGGALGNVIDRMIYGAVADFFHFHAFGRGWYVFNIADAAITVGVVALLVDAFVIRPETKDSNREPVSRN